MAEFLLSILAGTTHDHSTVSVGPEVHELVMGSLILTVSDFDSDTQSPLRRGSREEWVVCWQRNGLFRTRFGPRLTSQSLILESETKKKLLPIDKCQRCPPREVNSFHLHGHRAVAKLGDHMQWFAP